MRLLECSHCGVVGYLKGIRSVVCLRSEVNTLTFLIFSEMKILTAIVKTIDCIN